MNNKEIIDRLKGIDWFLQSQNYYSERDHEALNLAIETVVKASKPLFLVHTDGAIEPIRPQGEWIPVSERLPEDMQRVLIWFEYYRYGDFNCMYQTYGFGYVCDGEWSPFINGETGWQDKRIIAWQPLPEPYKEATDDD